MLGRGAQKKKSDGYFFKSMNEGDCDYL